ncbi:MAG: hypothetical protein IPK98_04190 [Chloracidobacterium sp.]|nr:hypothetical protein [Chloracidobacterium sp.]
MESRKAENWRLFESTSNIDHKITENAADLKYRITARACRLTKGVNRGQPAIRVSYILRQ